MLEELKENTISIIMGQVTENYSTREKEKKLMKRKQLVAVGILSICLFASGCGSNTASTEQGTENTVIVQETEMQETETQEVETQEVEVQEMETQETADNVISDENNESDITTDGERISVPCDGRDGTADAPYKIGDTIVFPNYRIGYTDENEEVSSNVTLVVQEATSDYIKVSVDYGIDSWAGIRAYDRMPGTYFFLRGFSDIGESLAQYSDPIYKDEAGNKIEKFDENETSIEAYLSYEDTRSEAGINIGEAKYLVFVKMGTSEGEDPYTYIILE